MSGTVDRRLRLADPASRTRRWRNWARTEEVTPLLTLQPSSVAEVQEAVRLAAELGTTVKAVGAGHSFTGIAVAPGIQLEMSKLSGLLGVDREARVVTLAAGTHLYEIPALLEPLGLAMANLGDIDKQTISGAVSTGTHGTGTAFGGIATQLLAVQLVIASGEVLEISPTSNPELWPAARLGLGALGVLTAVTLQCVPAFALAAVERRESLQDTLDRFESRCDAEDHFEFYWFPHTSVALTKTNTRLPADAELAPIHPVSRWVDDTVMANGLYRGMTALATTLPAVIPRFNRVAASVTGERRFTDRSTSVFTTSRTVRFREMEYAVDRAAVPAVLREIDALIERKRWNVSFPVEVRSAAADDLWLSTASGRLSGYIAVHKYWRETNYREYFAAVEEIFRAHEGRPHWGKLHTQNAESLAQLYPHHGDFVAVRDRLDPGRLFANDYLRRVLGE